MRGGGLNNFTEQTYDMVVKQSVLIVDDDSDDRHFVQEAFRLSKIDVDFVELTNANNIVSKLTLIERDHPVSLILLDLNMPGKNGIEALREIKEDVKFTHIPTVVLTTSNTDKDRDDSYSMGANCFLSKPNSFDHYLKMLQSVAKLYLPVVN
ncbi:MAG TPA: response regulator [Flavitalea sp.]|nr:response regulator [Flavitalea sp.]